MAFDTPASDCTHTPPLEIAHVLFMDIVAYSRLPIDQQQRVLITLQGAVRASNEFSLAEAEARLISLPTGDGMALVFFGDPEAPVRAALEVSRNLRPHPEVKIRMGLHTGPVYRVADINANRNVAGGGINMAQRVMDCGDASHILLSSTVADVLLQLTEWTDALIDFGETEVKHGVLVHIYGISRGELGNRVLPTKLQAARRLRRTEKRKRASISLISVFAAAIVFVIVFRTRHATALTDKDTVVVADFENKTGDPVFDDTLRTALSISLEQSPFLNVLPEDKVSATLQMMVRPANSKLTRELAREVCQRTGSKAYISGTIARLGSHYWVALSAIECNDGKGVAKEQSEAGSKEDVLRALSGASSNLRTKLGESLPSVHRFDTQVEVTTSSLAALQAYGKGVTIWHEQGETPSIPFLKRAVELDPNFAMAYAALTQVYALLQQVALATEYGTKAYDLRDRVSERERFRIVGSYFFVTGNVEKEVQNYEEWIASYPRDPIPYNRLGVAYLSLCRFDKALTALLHAKQLEDDNANTYMNLGLTYVYLNRLDEAGRVFEEALTHNVDSGGLRVAIYQLAFLRGDVAQMEKQVNWAAGKPGDEDQLLSAQSDTEAYYGHMKKARDYSRRAIDSAIRSNAQETAARWQVNSANREAEVGNNQFAKAEVAAALHLGSNFNVKYDAALDLARAGDVDKAQALSAEIANNDPSIVAYAMPLIHAAIELRKGNYSQVPELLEPVTPYELGWWGNLNIAYLRGEAYLSAHNGTAAAAEFQKLLDHRGVVGNYVTGALAHLQIGRAYVMEGNTAKRRLHMTIFFLS